MAIFRKIHVTFWSDSFVSNLTEKEKLFYLYLLTNERTTQIGIYEITKKQIAFDLGYSINSVSDYLKLFQNHGKIMYNETTCEIAIKNWNKYNHNPSIKVKVLVNKELDKVKDKLLIDYLYSINTVSIPNPQEEEEQEEEQDKDKEIEERKLKFASTLQPFLNLYGKDMLNTFYQYWIEPSKSGKRLRFEDEKFWDLNRRLITWKGKEKNFAQKKETPTRRTTNEVFDNVKAQIMNGELEIKPIL